MRQYRQLVQLVRTMLTRILICSLIATVLCEKPIHINEDDWFRFREPPVPKSKSRSLFNVKQEWIDQRVDNFNPQNGETYKMVGSLLVCVSRFD